MLLTPFVRWQLRLFSAAAVIGAFVLAIYFIHVPTLLGIGRYQVTANFPAGAGLYQGAQVTYRGAPIGRVSSMHVADKGIDAVLQLENGTTVPADVTASLHSTSAVGEQYVDLVAPDRSTATPLHSGSTIPMSHTTIPVQIGPVLDNVDQLVNDIPPEQLTHVLHETSQALNGSGDDLGRLIDNGSQLLTAAQQNLQPTQQLLHDSEPLMESVNSTSSDIQKFSANLQTITAELKDGDADLRTLTTAGGPFATHLAAFLDALSPKLSALLTSALPVTQILADYNPALSALLTMYPKTLATVESVVLPYESTHEIRISVSNFDMPPACTQGYVPQAQQRGLLDTSHGDAPFVYCTAPANSPAAVRGVRNIPCPTDPSRRLARASECPN